jgi:hypothetical protein
MDEYEYDEGSDLDNWETEQVFQDHEGDDAKDEALDAARAELTAEILSVLPKPSFLDHFQTLLAAMDRAGK